MEWIKECRAEDLIVLDESGAHLALTRRYSRSQKVINVCTAQLLMHEEIIIQS